MKNKYLVCVGRFRKGPAFLLGVDREGAWGYDCYIHLFHKREFNEKMEPENRAYGTFFRAPSISLNSGGCLLAAFK